MENNTLYDTEFKVAILEAASNEVDTINNLYITKYLQSDYEGYAESITESISKFFTTILNSIRNLIKNITGKSSEDGAEENKLKEIPESQRRLLNSTVVKGFDYNRFLTLFQQYSNSVTKSISDIATRVKSMPDYLKGIKKDNSPIERHTRDFVKALTTKGEFVSEVPADKYINSDNAKKPSKEIIDEIHKIAEKTIKEIEDISKTSNNDDFLKFVTTETTRYSNNVSKAIKAASKSDVLKKAATAAIIAVVGHKAISKVEPKAKAVVNTIRGTFDTKKITQALEYMKGLPDDNPAKTVYNQFNKALEDYNEIAKEYSEYLKNGNSGVEPSDTLSALDRSVDEKYEKAMEIVRSGLKKCAKKDTVTEGMKEINEGIKIMAEVKTLARKYVDMALAEGVLLKTKKEPEDKPDNKDETKNEVEK